MAVNAWLCVFVVMMVMPGGETFVLSPVALRYTPRDVAAANAKRAQMFGIGCSRISGRSVHRCRLVAQQSEDSRAEQAPPTFFWLPRDVAQPLVRCSPVCIIPAYHIAALYGEARKSAQACVRKSPRDTHARHDRALSLDAGPASVGTICAFRGRGRGDSDTAAVW